MAGVNANNPQCTGLLEPVGERDYTDLKVEGTLPPRLEGMFVRNGPNPQFVPDGWYHSFQGDGMLHAVRLEDGRASYRNRFVQTRGYLAERKRGSAMYGGAFDAPNLRNRPLVKNPANTHIVHHAGHTLALCEGGPPYEVELSDLSTRGEYRFGGKLKSSFTGHPKRDADSGEMVFFGYTFTPPFLHYGVVDDDGTLSHFVPVPLEAATMMHDFAVTENYTVFLDLPVRMRLSEALKGTPITWEPHRGARFGIIPRRGYSTDVRWYEVDPCMVFHTVNAFEENGEIVMDAFRMDATTIAGMLDREEVKVRPTDEPDVPRLHRWRINPKTGQMRDQALDDTPTEFPRIHPELEGRPYRFAYSAFFAEDPDPSATVLAGWLKYDLEKGSVTRRPLPDGVNGGEPVFVPDPDGLAEDDGWVLAYAGDRERAWLYVFNAQDFDGEPQCRIEIPERVPFGFHGDWFPRDTYT